MNIRQSLILSLTVAAFAAPGISSAMSNQDNAQSSNTRAEVMQEVVVARQNGTLQTNLSRNYSTGSASVGTAKTRAEVAKEVQSARQDGSLQTVLSRDYPVLKSPVATGQTRAQVRSEYLNLSAAEESRIQALYGRGA